MKYSTVTNLKWVNPENTILECLVDIEGMGPTLFGASDADHTPYAASILKSARAGEYGPITPYQAPAVIEPPPIPSKELVASLAKAIQDQLDAFARTRNYDSMLSACTYVTSTVAKFAKEAQYCVEARDSTWSAAYAILADVEAGTRPAPTAKELLAALPALAWPA